MKRLAIMSVPHSYLFFHFFATPVDGKVELRTPTLVHPSTGKPIKWQDCKVISVHCDFPYEAVLFKLSSEEFDIVGEGERIPFVDFAIEERHVKVVDDPYPPLGLHENYCGYQVAPAVFSSSVEEWNKKCEEQMAEQDAKIAAAYPLRGTIDGIPVMARWETDIFENGHGGRIAGLKRLIGGVIPQKELVALGIPGEIRNANFPDFWINVRLDSRDSFVSNGAPQYKTADEYIDTPPCIMRRDSK